MDKHRAEHQFRCGRFRPPLRSGRHAGARVPSLNGYHRFKPVRPGDAFNETGGFVAVWGGSRSDTASYEVLGQRYEASGTPTGIEFLVNTYTTGTQSDPAVAVDASGNFVVVWLSYGQDGSQSGIFGQRFDSAGNRLGGEFAVNSYTTRHQSFASVASDRSGNFVVVWQSYGQNGMSYSVFARWYDTAGRTDGPEFQVNSVSLRGDYHASLAFEGVGRFVVVWAAWRDGDEATGIAGQRFASDVIFRNGFQ